MSEIPLLDAQEQRVIGVLIEKSLATPQYYPLTLNQVVTACNQKSNRDPVVSMMEDEVDAILSRLARRAMTTQVFVSGSRAGKWRQELTSELELDGPSMAVLAELLLRGAQTVGELRTRASRMKAIADMGELNRVLEGLAQHQPPLARRLTPPGIQRGVRWGHLLQSDERIKSMSEFEQEDLDPVSGITPVPMVERGSVASVPENQSLATTVKDLELRINELAARIDDLEKRSS
ncbi:MAG: DUF480 domain-containing protein [Planctomycetota bacterium]|nr:DUF480 domain-containing protein [Planctomycetota bacterium]